MKMSHFGAALFASAATLTCAHAQVLLQWSTFGNSGMEVSEASVFNDPNLNPAAILLGAGIDTAGNSHRFGGSNWFDVGDSNPTTLAEAVADNDYYEITVAPLGGVSFTVTSFVFNWEHSAAGPNAVALRSSLDGFTADLGSVTGLTTALSTGNTITLTGLADLTAPLTLRLYGWGATSVSGTGGFDIATNAVNVQLNGTTAIPEPTTYAAALGMATLLVAACRRRGRRPAH